MADPQSFPPHPRRRRQPIGFDAQYGKVSCRIPTNKRSQNLIAAGKADVDVLIAMDNMMSGDDHAIRRPNDPAGRQTAPRLYPNDTLTGFLHRFRESIRDVFNFFHG
jgi:hypothetical protein